MGRATVFREESLLTTSHSDGAPMVEEIGRSMAAALNHGDAVVCIATGSQRRLFEQQLTMRGIDIVGALMGEQLVCLNALDTLMKIMVDDVPDVIRFAEVIGAAVDRAAVRYPAVLLFAELASLLRSNASGAMKLDALWESFVDSRSMFTRCPERVAVRQNYNRGLPFDDALTEARPLNS